MIVFCSQGCYGNEASRNRFPCKAFNRQSLFFHPQSEKQNPSLPTIHSSRGVNLSPKPARKPGLSMAADPSSGLVLCPSSLFSLTLPGCSLNMVRTSTYYTDSQGTAVNVLLTFCGRLSVCPNFSTSLPFSLSS